MDPKPRRSISDIKPPSQSAQAAARRRAASAPAKPAVVVAKPTAAPAKAASAPAGAPQPVPAPPKPKRPRRWPKVLLGILIIAAVAGLTFAWYWFYYRIPS